MMDMVVVQGSNLLRRQYILFALDHGNKPDIQLTRLYRALKDSVACDRQGQPGQKHGMTEEGHGNEPCRCVLHNGYCV